MDTLERMEDELAQHRALLEEQRAWLAELGVLVVHLHEDLRGLRERASLYDPACYEAPEASE